MKLATDCPDCSGTGIIPSPYDPAATHAHARQDLCGCGVLRERDPAWADAIERYDGKRPFSKHKLVIVRHTGVVAWVDEKIAPDVHRLWSAGIGTVTSCQGGAWPCENAAPYIEIGEPGKTEEAAALVPWVKAANLVQILSSVFLYGPGCRPTGDAFLVCGREGCATEHPALRRGRTGA